MSICRVCQLPGARGTSLCETHYREAMERVGASLAAPRRAPAQMPLSGPVTTRYVEPTKPHAREPYRERVAREARERTEDLAARVTEIVQAAEAHPVQRRELAAEFGNIPALTRAIAVAVERGDVRAVRSSPQESGLYPPES